MQTSLIFGILIFLQALAIGVDEFYFHFKRGLPRWERIGHPVDSASVLVCFTALYFTPYSGTTPAWLAGIMIFSSVLITKDEWIHHEHCEAKENWLHSILFLLHPLLFLAGWQVWREQDHREMLGIQSLALLAFLLYQIIYWNFIYPKKELRVEASR